ncbi:MAG: fasciclin domain-containing protein [Hyphomonas sp.]|uniref:fasciclin domain-containing protein n=1 Tax=Hyphomonas sp. TaxID=87 RepID=UPI0034A04286
MRPPPADETTVAPEAYASVETGAEDNLAPPFDIAADLSDETATVMMSEQADGTALSAEGDIDQTTAGIASQDSRFSTLVELVGIAGLQEALSLEGPYTVFAPTNDAFAALPESTLARLRSEEGKAELAEILKAHVAEGAVLAGEVPLAGQTVETLADTSMIVTGSADGRLNVGGSTTIGEGISASNGVVYAIDAVILPEAAPEAAPETPALGTEG